jgi:hypothetical protein
MGLFFRKIILPPPRSAAWRRSSSSSNENGRRRRGAVTKAAPEKENQPAPGHFDGELQNEANLINGSARRYRRPFGHRENGGGAGSATTKAAPEVLTANYKTNPILSVATHVPSTSAFGIQRTSTGRKADINPHVMVAEPQVPFHWP